MTGLNIGICGGGVGGLAAAIVLDLTGHRSSVFEQASEFTRIGADVNLTSNAVHSVVLARAQDGADRDTAPAALRR